MLTITATDFANSLGRRNREVRREAVIEVTSHGHPVGYYLSPEEYERVRTAMSQTMRHEVKARRAEIRALAERHGATRIRLFGSVARGEDKPFSDIDFLVSFPQGRHHFREALRLGADLEALFGGRRIDLVDESRMQADIGASILAGAIDLDDIP